MGQKNRMSGRRLSIEPLEERQLLSATWYQYAPINSSVGADDLEMWDFINQMRENPQEMLYKIFDHPENLYHFDEFNAGSADTIRAAKDIAVDSAIKSWIIKDATGDKLKSIVDDFFNNWYALESADPLALNKIVTQVASTHNALMISKGQPEHQLTGEDSLADRLLAAGFELADGSAPTENIAYSGKKSRTDSSGYFCTASSYLFSAMVIDWGVATLGHRTNLMDSSVTEVGICVKQTQKSIGPYVTTVDFAASTDGVSGDGGYLFGLIYDDQTGDEIYTAGKNEGLSYNPKNGYSVTVRQILESGEGESVVINSISNGLAQEGGYQIYLQNGTYEVTISGGVFGTGFSRTVTIDGANVKADFLLQYITVEKPVLDLNGEEEGTGTEVIFVEQSPEAVLIPDDFIFSSGGTTIKEMTVLFRSTGRPDGANESVNVTLPEGSVLTVLRNTQTGDLKITGSGTEEEYRQVIASLVYLNLTDGYADLSDRTIEIAVYNGLYWSDTAVVTVSILPTLFPALSISDASVWEGDASAESGDKHQTLVFQAVLDGPARLDAVFRYTIEDQTTVAGKDYSAADAAGEVTIRAGETTAEILVTVYGNYEAQEDRTFLLTVTGTPENLYWDGVKGTGTIRDDDTPVMRCEKTASWSSEATGSFEQGERRYLYTYTAVSDGLVQWSAVGPNMTVTVYSGWSESACAAPVTVSEKKNGRQTAEWFAAAGVEYYIKLEGPYYYRSPSLTFLPVTEDKTVLIDPLLDDEGLLTAGFKDGQLVLGNESRQWTIPDSVLANVTLSSVRADAQFALQLDDAMAADFDTGDNRLSLGNRYVLSFDNISNFLFSGADSGEILTITGSDGNDQLNYSRGNGTLILNADDESKRSVYTFTNLTRLDFDGGGGKDTASLYDSSSNDIASYQGQEVTLSGGGYALGLKNFNDVTLGTVNGGRNTLAVTLSEEDMATTSVGSIWITGSCTFQASGLSSIQVEAGKTENSVSVLCEENENVRYQAVLGSVSAVNKKTSSNLSVKSAYKLVLYGVAKESEQVAIAVPEDCEKTEDDAGFQYTKGAYALQGHYRIVNQAVSSGLSSAADFGADIEDFGADIDSAIGAFPVSAVVVRAADAAILQLTGSAEEDSSFCSGENEPETSGSAEEFYEEEILPAVDFSIQETAPVKRKKFRFFSTVSE